MPDYQIDHFAFFQKNEYEAHLAANKTKQYGEDDENKEDEDKDDENENDDFKKLKFYIS